jgi:hypothetical protein
MGAMSSSPALPKLLVRRPLEDLLATQAIDWPRTNEEMPPNRHRQYDWYTRLSPAARRGHAEERGRRATSELVAMWIDDGDYVARDVLVSRGVFSDTSNCELNDYGHHVLAQKLNATRIQLAHPQRLQRLSGTLVPGIGRAYVTTRRMSHNGTTKTLNAGRPGVSNRLNLHWIITMLFARDFSLLEAWALPLDLVDELRRAKASLPHGGTWTSHPRVSRLDI